ncbi:MAG: ABC transporter permease [Alphaproteobacteria bacterium]|nr:ABC transporter permease [Alphaproteobacteria bacterium]
MSGIPHLSALVRAEVRKLASRTSVRLSIVALVLLGLVMPLILLLISSMVTVTTEAGQAQMKPPSFDAAMVLTTVLTMRNFFLFRAMVIAVVAVSFAGELVARTLREDLVRPVTRGTVLLAKWLALQVFVAVGLFVPLVVAGLLGLVCFGPGEGFVDTLLGAAITWAGDAGFATLVMGISLVLRSVPGTIGGVFLYWVLDRALGWGIKGAEKAQPLLEKLFEGWGMAEAATALHVAVFLRPWLPSSAFDIWWDYVPGAPLVWQSWVALVVYTALAYTVAWSVFRRIDVD